MKTALTTHDIFVLVKEMQKCKSYRVLNIYDINSQTICIKFNTENSEKKYLFIESGAKFYFLDTFNATKDFPSSFSLKLRKHLNNKRLEMIRQVNIDRVIDLQFGTNDLAFHIIAEFYASGNIILTDANYKIMTLIRPYTYKDQTDKSSNIRVAVGQIYPFDQATTNIDLTQEYIINCINDKLISTIDPTTTTNKTMTKTMTSNKIKLKQFIIKLPIIKFGIQVLEHAIIKSGIDPNKKINSESVISDIFTSTKCIQTFIDTINELYSDKPHIDNNLDNFKGITIGDNVYPYAYAQLNMNQAIISDSFTQALSKYYQTVQPIETKATELVKAKQLKITKEDKVVYNIEQQIKQMNSKIEMIDQLIENISYDLPTLDQLLENYIYNKSHYRIKDERFNVINCIPHIRQIDFTFANLTYSFDYSKSIYDNIGILYGKRKAIEAKRDKAEKLLEETINKYNKSKKDLLAKTTKSDDSTQTTEPTEPIGSIEINNKPIEHIEIKGQIKPNWFEQFNWFISSDGLLFISGKTADQNEVIVKKYMLDNDIYIHSEVFGSGSGIIKNHANCKIDIAESYPKTIIEAGQFLIAHTKAWKSGIPDKAYWVRPSQVSKTPESGEYLTKGSFIIRGHKNFILVDKLELGFGYIFKLKTIDNVGQGQRHISYDKNNDHEEIDNDQAVQHYQFVSSILPNTNVEYAIPMMAPYSIMDKNKFKFKVKVIPGSQKIKKALVEVMGLLLKKANLMEKLAIKKISNDSIQKVLVTGVRFII